MTAPVLAMEDHCEAYFAWKRAGVRDAWCWHVDAHLDIGRDGLDTEGLARCPSLAEAETRGLCGNAYLPWGGLHCGNYLYPAIREGTVTRLSWVIPPDLPVGNLLRWTREHLNGWFDLTVRESVELHDAGGYVSGTVLGIPLEVGPAAALPAPEIPVLLDVDLDYFLTTRGELWSEPESFPESRFTTVAYSVKGGYTPAEYRRLALHWVEACEGYQPTDLDTGAQLLRLQRYREAVDVLMSQPSLEAGYLLGTCFHHLELPEQALETWLRLLESFPLEVNGRAYLHGLASEALATLARPQEALAQARAALQQVDSDYRLCWAAAVALEQLGELRQATQMLRRGLRLAEPYVFGLSLRAALARLYRKQEKHGLASLELAELERADLGGQFRPLTLLR